MDGLNLALEFAARHSDVLWLAALLLALGMGYFLELRDVYRDDRPRFPLLAVLSLLALVAGFISLMAFFYLAPYLLQT